MEKNFSDAFQMQEYWINSIAPKYFKFNNSLNHRVGQFGYINEISSNIVVDTMNMLKIYYREAIPNKAILPETLNAFMGLANVNDIFSKPSYMTVSLTIPTDRILKYSEEIRNGLNEYIISKDNKLIVGGYEFYLDYDIVITAKNVGGSNKFTARYDMSNNNNLSDITSPYIKSAVVSGLDTNVLILECVIRQVSKSDVEFKTTSTDIIDVLYNEVSYSGDLADFRVFYKGPTDSKYRKIEKVLDGGSPKTNEFVYYTIGDNVINLSYSKNIGEFRPAFNSTIKVRTITSEGQDGSFEINEDEADNIVEVQYATDNANVPFSVVALTDSMGGVDKPSEDDMKRLISQSFSAHENIGNVNDLDNYFNSIQDDFTIKFIKKQDDLFKRQFSAFMLMKDFNNSIIPTNTVNLKLTDTDFDITYPELGLKIIRPKAKFTINSDLLSRDETIVDVDTYEQSNTLYGNNYLMILRDNPTMVSYYINSVSKYYNIEYGFINDSSITQFICRDLKVEHRRDATHDYYDITFNLMPNINDVNDIINYDAETDTFTTTTNYKFVGVVHTNGSKSNYCNFEITDYDPNTDRYKMEATFSTQNSINDSNLLGVIDGLYKPMEEVTSEAYIELDNIKLDICVFKSGLSETLDYSEMIPNLSGYGLTNVYTTVDDYGLDLMINITNIVNSTLTITEDGLGGYEYNLTEVPVIRYSYLDMNLEMINDILHMKQLHINDALIVLKNNFSIDMKYYNTYGASRNYTVGVEKIPLDKIHLSLKFKARLIDNNDNNTKFEMMEYIRDYIQESNDGGNDLYMSELIKSTSNEFSNLVFIQLVSINDYTADKQIIEFKQDSQQNNNYIPEYLNVNKDIVAGNELLDIEIQIV